MQNDSQYLAHFTKGDDAYDKIVSILQDQKIKSGNLPWVNKPAVCLTECPWASLINHANNYSSYGVGFSKKHVFAAGGGPAYYVRADHYEKQEWHSDLHAFVTPFWPAYRPKKLRTPEHLSGKTVDYSHEREWRVPHDFSFDRKRVSFIVLASYEDMAKFPRGIKDDIGREKFILMENYKKIEELWPTHVHASDG